MAYQRQLRLRLGGVDGESDRPFLVDAQVCRPFDLFLSH